MYVYVCTRVVYTYHTWGGKSCPVEGGDVCPCNTSGGVYHKWWCITQVVVYITSGGV